MKMTIEKIREAVDRDKALKDNMQVEIDKLTKQIEKLESECQAANDAGDVDTYYQKLQEKEKTAAALHVKKAYLEKISSVVPVSDTAAREAWKSYVSVFNAKLDKQMSAFKAKRDELNAMYAAMVDLQNDACKTREFLARVSGIPFEFKTFEMHKLSDLTRLPIETRFTTKRGAIKLDGFNCDDPDAVYYLACYEQNHDIRFSGNGYDLVNPNNERVRVQRVVARQEAFND